MAVQKVDVPMKYGIELNGVANLHIIIDEIKDGDTAHNLYRGKTQDLTESVEAAREQLFLLERYMIAFTEAMNKGVRPPYWHEIKENPDKYPRNGER